MIYNNIFQSARSKAFKAILFDVKPEFSKEKSYLVSKYIPIRPGLVEMTSIRSKSEFQSVYQSRDHDLFQYRFWSTILYSNWIKSRLSKKLKVESKAKFDHGIMLHNYASHDCLLQFLNSTEIGTRVLDRAVSVILVIYEPSNDVIPFYYFVSKTLDMDLSWAYAVLKFLGSRTFSG